MTFSFGRALQASALQAWKGKVENVKAGQAELAKRDMANGGASCGQYTGIASLAGEMKTFEANYAY